LQIKSEVL